MVDKWLDMLGLYDFLGVICPGIFAVGMGVFLWYVNIGIGDNLWHANTGISDYLWHVNTGINDEFLNFIVKHSFLKHFLYAFIIVAIYVLGSFIHELGHYCANIYNVGIWIGLLQFLGSVINNFKILFKGNCEAEKLFMERDFSNSNIVEREIWFELMQRGDFCKDNEQYRVNGTLEENLKKEKFENFKKLSAAFYQHCKRVISMKGFSASSKKKESIYGFCRNIGVIFGIMMIFVVWCSFTTEVKNIKLFGTLKNELIFLSIFFIVFSAKSIRYKNMEVIDTIRTYRYLAENKKKSGKK